MKIKQNLTHLCSQTVGTKYQASLTLNVTIVGYVHGVKPIPVRKNAKEGTFCALLHTYAQSVHTQL